jgi:hypothetical protein
MGHDRDAGRHQLLDLVRDPLAALQLDRVRPRLLQEADRGGQCIPG